MIHTVKPKCLIEVFNAVDLPGNLSASYPFKAFTYIQSNGGESTWVLIIRDVYDESSDDMLEKLLERAWRWFRAYLEQVKL